MVERTCQQCGKTYRTKAGQRLKYCAAACYFLSKQGKPLPKEARRRQEELSKKTCPECGKEFTRQQFYLKPYCSLKCLTAVRRKAFEKWKEGGSIPAVEITEGSIWESYLVAVFPDHIICKCCGKSFTQASTHFRRSHGMTELNKKLSRLERLELYGLSLGSRLAPPTLLEEQSERMKDNPLENGVEFVPSRLHEARKNIEARPLPSPKQGWWFRSVIGTEKHGGAIRRQRAAVTRTCCACGNSYTTPRHLHQKVCSNDCNRILASRRCKQWAGDPDRIKRAIAGLKEARKTKHWSSRNGPEWHKDVTCSTCGKTFNVIKSKERKYCSKACQYQSQKGKPVPRGPKAGEIARR